MSEQQKPDAPVTEEAAAEAVPATPAPEAIPEPPTEVQPAASEAADAGEAVPETAAPEPEPEPVPAVAAAPEPEAQASPWTDAPPVAEPAPGWDANLSGSGEALAERPEVLVGAAFAGGVVLALILKRLAR